MFATSSAILSSAYPPGERGRVLGINVSSVYIGLSVGPFVGGVLTQNFGWHSVFWASALVGVVAVVAALRRDGRVGGEPRRAVRLGRRAHLRRSRLQRRCTACRGFQAGTGAVLIAAGLAGLAGFADLGDPESLAHPQPEPLPEQPGLHILQPGRVDQLPGDDRGNVSAQPVPPVHQGPDAAAGRPPARRAAGHDGASSRRWPAGCPTGSSRASWRRPAWP